MSEPVWKAKWFRYGLSVGNWEDYIESEEKHDLVSDFLDRHPEVTAEYIQVSYKGYHAELNRQPGKYFYKDVLAMAEAEHGY